MTTRTVPHRELTPGTIVLGPNDERVEIVRGALETTETVLPLAGRPLWRYWARCPETGREGFMSYGDGGVARILVAA